MGLHSIHSMGKLKNISRLSQNALLQMGRLLVEWLSKTAFTTSGPLHFSSGSRQPLSSGLHKIHVLQVLLPELVQPDC